MPSRFFTLIIALACTTSMPAFAQVYRWVDEDGKVHYSDKPVENAERVEMRVTQPETPAPAEQPEESSGSAIDQQIANEADPVKKAELELLKQRCRRAQELLDSYNSAPFLEETLSDGTKRRLPPEETAAEKQRVSNEIAKNCK
ncbi:MAG: DUF4124 domain-containing protein [Gammaproteobacteria bacterium]|nr:DUF4124 domain-containing protein [Gammaproteobacteria bacterium]